MRKKSKQKQTGKHLAAMLCCAKLICAAPHIPDIEGEPIGKEPLFVSLGSNCQMAYTLRDCTLRKFAFPFDWIMSLDGEKIIELLDDDFAFFLDERFLYVGPLGPGFLMQGYYRMEFLHEGDFRGQNFLPNLENLKIKYTKRIKRFQKLKEYLGKVIFIRSAFKYSTTDPHRIFFCEENLEITNEYSRRLCDALKRYFPKLDFLLIIVNMHDGEGITDEQILSDHLIKIRSNPSKPRIEDFKNYFTRIIQQAHSE